VFSIVLLAALLLKLSWLVQGRKYRLTNDRELPIFVSFRFDSSIAVSFPVSFLTYRLVQSPLPAPR
jgi:hypothetical protein